MPKEFRHRLLAIMAADAAGYSRLMSIDDVGTMDALERARKVFRSQVEAEGGRVVDTSGDSVLAVFDTTNGAVRTAAAVQAELAALSERVPEHLRLRFRIGIHLGDVVEKADGSVYGDGVNIASRLQALADPGGVIVSHAVEETASHRTHLGFEDIGNQSVKNIATPVKAFRLSLRNVPTAQPPNVPPTGPAGADGRHAWALPLRRWRTWLATGALVGAAILAAAAAWRWQPVPRVNVDEEIEARRAIAVLAFNDKRTNGGGSPLGDDLADAVSGQLLHNGMRVIERATTMHQNPAAPEFERIGAEQHVKYVLGGRITQVGDAARVATYLTEIETGEVYRLFQTDFKTEDEAARSNYARLVMAALRARYYEIETARARLPGRDKDPVDAIVLGWRDVDRGSQEDLQSARHRFEFAANADPNSVKASTALGVAHLLNFYYFYSDAPRAELDLTEKALKHALDLAPDNTENLVAWAEMLMLRQKPDDAFWVWRRALEASPEDQNAHLRLASALLRQGRYAEAAEHIGQVTELRPYQRRQQWFSQTLADLAFAQEHDDEAYAILRNWAAESPNNGRPYLMLAAIDALHGRTDAAKANMAKHRQMVPLSNVAYVVLTYPSTDPDFLAQRARLIDGLRKAGLPEGGR
ncbi:MAG: tetratricopeptide repeat protein [Variovorax sp.]|nr:tetratricopeptide repeat protein [Variovorax sp.]